MRVHSTSIEPSVANALLDNSSDALFAMTPDGEVQAWNWGGEQTLGLPTPEVLGRSIYETFVPSDRAGEFAKAIHEALATGSAVFESEAARAGGARFHCLVILKALPPSADGVRRIGAMLRDVSEEKRLEQQLFEQIWSLTEVQGFLQGVLDGSTDYAIVATDASGAIRAWSRGAEVQYGYESKEVVGRPASEVLFAPGETETDAVQRAFEAAKKGAFEEEFLAVDKSGRRFPARVSIGPRRDGSGELQGYVLIAKDVTEERAAAEAIRRKTAFVTLLQNVAVAANEAKTIEDAMQRALDEVCLATGWPVGHVYVRPANGPRASARPSCGTWRTRSGSRRSAASRRGRSSRPGSGFPAACSPPGPRTGSRTCARTPTSPARRSPRTSASGPRSGSRSWSARRSSPCWSSLRTAPWSPTSR